MRSFDPLISATVDSVYNDSPALYAGMQSGDIIVSVNEQSIYDWGDFLDWINNNPDDIIDVEVERGNSIYKLNIDRNDDGTIGVLRRNGIKTKNKGC